MYEDVCVCSVCTYQCPCRPAASGPHAVGVTCSKWLSEVHAGCGTWVIFKSLSTSSCPLSHLSSPRYRVLRLEEMCRVEWLEYGLGLFTSLLLLFVFNWGDWTVAGVPCSFLWIVTKVMLQHLNRLSHSKLNCPSLESETVCTINLKLGGSERLWLCV